MATEETHMDGIVLNHFIGPLHCFAIKLTSDIFFKDLLNSEFNLNESSCLVILACQLGLP